MEVEFFLRDLEGADPDPRPERVAALTECAQRFAGEAWSDKVVVFIKDKVVVWFDNAGNLDLRM